MLREGGVTEAGWPPSIRDPKIAPSGRDYQRNSQGDAYVTDEKNRGRQETRYPTVSEITDEFQEISYEWPGLKAVDVVMSFRHEGGEAPETPMIRYYISSAKLIIDSRSAAHLAGMAD